MRPFRSRLDTVILSFVFIVVALLVAALCSPGYAQQQVATRFQYAVKTLCTLGGDVGFGDAFAPGRYRTVINIHNPTERKIEIARKFALAIPPGEAPGSFSITPVDRALRSPIIRSSAWHHGQCCSPVPTRSDGHNPTERQNDRRAS
jgi:hypothetical protein